MGGWIRKMLRRFLPAKIVDPVMRRNIALFVSIGVVMNGVARVSAPYFSSLPERPLR